MHETDSLVLDKIRWWQDLKFGLFIHWGIYSVWGCVESWPIVDKEPYGRDILPQWEQSGRNPQRFMQMYFEQNQQFNPERFDPEQWVHSAKTAGMKYLVFTTKHHDGFCMYDTKTTDFRVTHPSCPFHSNRRANILRSVYDAFRKEGFGIGTYFSKADWHHHDYWCSEFPRLAREVNYDPVQYPRRWERYVRFVHQQITELMTEYGKTDILWMDSDWVKAPLEDIQMDTIAAIARKHQPGILMVNRNVGDHYENYTTPEQKVPDEPMEYPWETCMTMGDQWSYKPDDRYKSSHELIHLLVNIIAKGGNFLLGAGPGPDGLLHSEVTERLEEIGQWMSINHSAVYATRPVSPYKQNNLCLTQKGSVTNVLYLAEENQTTLPPTIEIPFIKKAQDVRLLGSPAALNVKMGTDGLVVAIPEGVRNNPPCQHVWVFEITNAMIKP